MNMNDLQEMLDEFLRKRKRKAAQDGEIVVAPMAIMDSWRGVAQVNFEDASLTDQERMDLAYQKSVRDLNAWRDQGTPSAASISPADASLSDRERTELAYERSVSDLNAWRNN